MLRRSIEAQVLPNFTGFFAKKAFAGWRAWRSASRALPLVRVVALAIATGGAVSAAAQVETFAVGLAADGTVIEGMRVAAGRGEAPVIAIVGGLDGEDAGSRAISTWLDGYAQSTGRDRALGIVAVPVANPARRPLVFPPTGPAYRELPESHALWRWLGLGAVDLVLVADTDGQGLVDALSSSEVAGVAAIPARRIAPTAAAIAAAVGDLGAELPRSAARDEIERRRSRTPPELAELLAPIYGQNFDPPIYIDGMALLAHLGMGNLDHVVSLAEPYVDGSQDSLAGRFGLSSLVLAGHLVFAELAAETDDARYLERARAAADVAFTEDGEMLEAMPQHGEMSDSIFMGASILAAVGDLTGDVRYFDMAARHIEFMNALVRREDGLYRHSPLTDAAWGRGNGFAAIGYALTLSKLPETHPAHGRLLAEYRELMTTLARWQNADGTWRQVVDQRGAYHETSSTAIIGFSMQRGLNRGWLDRASFEPRVERAWRAVSQRTDDDGGFIDVSESTNKQPSLEAYLTREALFGRDPRTGSFAMLFSVERSAAAR